MRREFSTTIEKIAREKPELVFLTGDLGFMALENVRDAIGERFINAGVSEQNMVSLAAAMASEGLLPVCYSIAPFMVYRPAEQIRLDVCLHNLNVKIVGNGGGYGYGIMGATHHALEDIAVLSSFQHMRCFIPFSNEDVAGTVAAMFAYTGPSYFRLGFGTLPEGLVLPPYQPVRKLYDGEELTIIGMGPVLLNLFKVPGMMDHTLSADVFAISEVPLPGLTLELIDSIRKTSRVLVIEEHVKRGGLGEHLAAHILENNLSCTFKQLYAEGYPDGLYGSQGYHQSISGLDAVNIAQVINQMIHG